MGKSNIITADGIAVRCAYDEIVKVSDLKRHPENPNKHPVKQLEIYSKVVRYQGFRRAPTVSRQTGLMTRGNGLHEMCEVDRIEEMPVDYQDYDSLEQELADVLADRYLQELAEMDLKQSDSILRRLNGKIDMELTGLPLTVVEGRMEAPSIPVLTFDPSIPPPTAGAPVPAPSGSPPEPPAAVKCIQFFIDLKNIEEYERKVGDLKIHFKSQNNSDTVLEAIRHAHAQFCGK
jgi:hypothetical protein